jgi:hypothetical protein
MRFDGTDIKTVVKVTAPSTGGQGGPPTPDEVVLAPDGKHALVRANRNVFLITVPPIGGNAPTVSAAATSSVPTWRLTKVGGDFVGWTSDGSAAHYSIGRSFFLHDLATAATVDATNRANADAEAERTAAAAAAPAPPTPAPQPIPRRSRQRPRRSRRRSSTSRTASTSRSSSTRTSRPARLR